jgi:hypothetical protein
MLTAKITSIKISDLSSLFDIKEEDFTVVSRGGKSFKITQKAITEGFGEVSKLDTSLKSLSSAILFPVDSPTINLSFNSHQRLLSADVSFETDESAIGPQSPLVFTENVLVANNMHNKTVLLSSTENIEVMLPVQPLPGCTIRFLRAGPGEVKFVAGISANVKSTPTDDYNKITYQNSSAMAYKISNTDWIIRGKLIDNDSSTGHISLDFSLDELI